VEGGGVFQFRSSQSLHSMSSMSNFLTGRGRRTVHVRFIFILSSFVFQCLFDGFIRVFKAKTRPEKERSLRKGLTDFSEA